jgi:bifunctional polynucleotide phosphatase/kinase
MPPKKRVVVHDPVTQAEVKFPVPTASTTDVGDELVTIGEAVKPSSPAPVKSAVTVTAPNTFTRKIDPKDKSWEKTAWSNAQHAGLIQFLHHTIPPAGPNGEVVLPRVAAFDMDHTLIKPKDGRTFPNDENDWEWMYPGGHVQKKLKELYESGYDIVIFTNQLDITDVKSKQLHKKIMYLSAELGIPISAYLATQKDHFRKPARCMFDVMLDNYDAMLTKQYPTVSKFSTVIHPDSFYAGDAAGRDGLTPTQLKKNPNGLLKDHSAVDLNFAINCLGYSFNPKDTSLQTQFPGQSFYVPESLFLGEKSKAPFSSKAATSPYDFFDPKNDKYVFEKTPLWEHISKNSNHTKSQMIILVGTPASGKTTFTQTLIKRFETEFDIKDLCWVNQDTLKTPAKCQNAANAGLQSGKIVIVDNTNVTTDKRKDYIQIAKKHGVPVHVVFISVPKLLSFHLNMVRACHTLGERERISSIPIHSLAKTLVEPEAKEGFETVTHVPYVPLTTQYTESTPRPAPPLGPSERVVVNGYREARSEAYTNQFGRISASRGLEDYYYQLYEH